MYQISGTLIKVVINILSKTTNVNLLVVLEGRSEIIIICTNKQKKTKAVRQTDQPSDWHCHESHWASIAKRWLMNFTSVLLCRFNFLSNDGYLADVWSFVIAEVDYLRGRDAVWQDVSAVASKLLKRIKSQRWRRCYITDAQAGFWHSGQGQKHKPSQSEYGQKH